MKIDLAQALMNEFADVTGLLGNQPPRRYLWTDAFAVCNYLGLYRKSGSEQNLNSALKLVHQVHHILGCHRTDDARRGWISGLPEDVGELHPTRGGLRIGKPLNERQPDQPMDAKLEWDRDGQYFHYLTKWMHALMCATRATGDTRHLRWATELATTAHRAFTYEVRRHASKRMFWKMSIDLTRPLVSSMGQHDPLDGLITCLELQYADEIAAQSLSRAISDFDQMCILVDWATADPLGIGGLLDDSARLARLVFERGVNRRELLHQLLRQTALSLQALSRSSSLSQAVENRLAFRELGLAIGIRQLECATKFLGHDTELNALVERLLPYNSLAEQIETFWLRPAHRSSSLWIDHQDIDTVMLATSLLADSYFEL